MEPRAMNTPESLIGVVRPEELYTLEALKQRMGIRDATLRAARRSGMKVHYKHGRGFVRGADWISYVCKAEPQVAEKDGLDEDSSNPGNNSSEHGPTVDRHRPYSG